MAIIMWRQNKTASKRILDSIGKEHSGIFLIKQKVNSAVETFLVTGNGYPANLYSERCMAGIKCHCDPSLCRKSQRLILRLCNDIRNEICWQHPA
ncbi:hypothetical protein FKM82_002037 [Ascaphus truei]